MAKPFALPAGIGTDGAVFVLLRMTVTFVATNPTGLRTGFEHYAKDRFVASGSARCHRTGGATGIGTVQIEPDALGQLLDHVFAQAGVGTGDAGLFAIEAGLDAADENVVGVAADMGMGTDHLLSVHVCLLQEVAKGGEVKWNLQPPVAN